MVPVVYHVSMTTTAAVNVTFEAPTQLGEGESETAILLDGAYVGRIEKQSLSRIPGSLGWCDTYVAANYNVEIESGEFYYVTKVFSVNVPRYPTEPDAYPTARAALAAAKAWAREILAGRQNVGA